MFVTFLTFSVIMTAQCKIETGNLIVESLGNQEYSLYLSQKPINTCFPVSDSSSLWVGILCSSTGNYASEWLKWSDTLKYTFSGHITLVAKIKWYKQGNAYAETHIFVPDVFETGHNCYTKIGTYSVPNIIPPVITPPVFVPEFNINNEIITTNVGGTLIIMSYPNFDNIIVKEYDNQFTFNLLPGWWYCYLILDDGTTLGNTIIQN